MSTDVGIQGISDGLPRVKAGDARLTLEQINKALSVLCRNHAEDLAVVLGIATDEERAAFVERGTR